MNRRYQEKQIGDLEYEHALNRMKRNVPLKPASDDPKAIESFGCTLLTPATLHSLLHAD